jgi:DNA polymerase-3 subunit delta
MAQVRPHELGRHLEGELAPVYLISGDEPLIVQEACDDLLASARKNGYTEREVVSVETGYRWSSLVEAAGSMSLFSERRILDLRVPPKRFDREASDVLRAYLENPPDDVLILLRTERLDPGQRRSAWFKAIDATGVVVLVWPLGPQELPRWLSQRCRRAGIELSRDALARLQARVEGNLLAAVQEIDKLVLAGLPQPVSAQALDAAVLDASHYDAFDLVDGALGGQGPRVKHMVRVLKAEGVAPLAVLGAVVSQLRRLLTDARGGVPPQRQRLINDAKRRLDRRTLEALLNEASGVDQQVKGMVNGDPWQGLEDLMLKLAGARTLRRDVDLARRW